MKLQKILLALFTIVLVSCSSDDSDPKPVSDRLVGIEFIDSRTAEELQFLVQLSGRDLDPTIFQHDVKVYRMTYLTTYKDEEIEASAILALPVGSEAMSILSFQHGTEVAHSEAPSEQNGDSFDVILYGAMASTGFITVIPDYIGFGASKEVFHPYYVEETTAAAVLDAVLAASEAAEQNNVQSDNRLFLAGYSQGGYATLAAHKAIEEEGLQGIELVASFPASGGYDLPAMRDYFFSATEYDQPFYIAYVAKSYQTYYGFSSIYTDIFNEPFATTIPAMFNGTNSGSTINGQLTNNISELIRSDIRANFESNSQYDYLEDAFEENSLTDWTPTIPVYFYHGTADITVPFENTQRTYETLLSNGTSAQTITLIPLPGADHGSGIEPYVEDVVEKLKQLK